MAKCYVKKVYYYNLEIKALPILCGRARLT
nr:MAG TPA: hypothetical protein [Caudoviricetes sp.]